MSDDCTPEALKPEDWAGDMGLRWLANLSLFEEMIAPIGDALLSRAAFQSGDAVIDFGCGGGATTLAIAQRVGPSGKAIGIDISPDLTKAAQERAIKSGTNNVTFICGDAATIQLSGAPYDRLLSRFGSMFFEDPVAAFSNLHGQLQRGGRMDLAVWGPPRENLWMMDMMGVVRNHMDVPPAMPRAPGPFSFEDLEYLREVLNDSGFSDVDVSAYEGLQPVGGTGATPEQAVKFALSSLAIGRLLSDKGDEIFEAVVQELTELFARYYVAEKGILMKGKAWLVSAIA